MKTILKLIASSMVALLSVSAHANLITNGSFESNVQANHTWNNYLNLTGWTGGKYGIELRNNVAGAAYDGTNFVELDTYANSSMWQDIATIVGQSYTLSFAYSPREGVAASSNGISVLWNGALIANNTGSGIGKSGNVWSIYSYTVKATGTITRLQFASEGTSDSYGGSLDDVTLNFVPAKTSTNNVPEPTSIALLGLGLLGLTAARRRKQ